MNMPPYGREIPYTSPTGVKTTLYSISVLASRLGRTSQTVRKWEIAGILPPTPFKINGVRLYSEEHIESIVRSAEKSKIKQGKCLCNTQFSNRIYKDFKELHKKFFEEGD